MNCLFIVKKCILHITWAVPASCYNGDPLLFGKRFLLGAGFLFIHIQNCWPERFFPSGEADTCRNEICMVLCSQDGDEEMLWSIQFCKLCLGILVGWKKYTICQSGFSLATRMRMAQNIYNKKFYSFQALIKWSDLSCAI